jgi:hypothetical protein
MVKALLTLFEDRQAPEDGNDDCQQCENGRCGIEHIRSGDGRNGQSGFSQSHGGGSQDGTDGSEKTSYNFVLFHGS